MSLPRMPLHIGDYLKETAHLSAAEHGAYVLLIMHYWAKGSLPDDDVQLARITRMGPAQWRKARPVIQEFFQGGWKHKRIDEEIVAATERYEKFAKAGRESGKARAAQKEHRSNEAMNETPQSFEQPITDNPEVREGDNARARAGALARGSRTSIRLSQSRRRRRRRSPMDCAALHSAGLDHARLRRRNHPRHRR
jgi:uncharacterized protein YdaU (DUF1376 family)